MGEAKRRSDAWKRYALTGEKPEEMITTARPRSRHIQGRDPAINDPLREHSLDPEHIREELEVQRIAREEGIEHLMGNVDEKEEHRLVPPLEEDLEDRRLSQEVVELTKIRVAVFLMDSYLRRKENVVPPHHLWFPEDDVAEYELREGPAPENSERPYHLQNLHLDLDIGFIPPDVAQDLLEKQVANIRANREQDLTNTGLWTPK